METATTNPSTTTSHLPHVASINAVADFGKLATETALVDTTVTKQKEQHYNNCLSYTRGARVLFATDEWFAEARNLLLDHTPPVFDPHAFTHTGKVMDGWESRRRRLIGHDWCLIQLPERVRLSSSSSHTTTSVLLHVDTAYFTGNYAPALSVVGYDLDGTEATALVHALPRAVERLVQPTISRQGTCATLAETQAADAWLAEHTKEITLLERTPLQPGYEDTRHHAFAIENDTYITHIRVNMHPDGGIARMRLEGVIPAPRLEDVPESSLPQIDLPYRVPHNDSTAIPLPSVALRADPSLVEVTALAGCAGIDASDSHYGHPNHLLQSSMGMDMGDGWETARHTQRPPCLTANPEDGLVDFQGLHDWCILSLGDTAPSLRLHAIVIDTQHFRGNYPESIWIEGRNSDDEWHTIVPRSRLSPDAEHVLTPPNDSNLPVPSQLRLTIYPDGGLSRVRVFAKEC